MAEEMTVRGVWVKKRNPWGVWALNLITFGIYGIVYWAKINSELRDYSAALGRGFNNSPTLAVLALFPGGFVVLPPYFTIGFTAGRVRRMQEMTRTGGDAVMPAIAVLLAILFAFHLVYIQYALNRCWDQAKAEAAGAGAL